MFAVQKYYLEAKTSATLTGKASRGRMLIEDKSVKVPLTVLCAVAASFVILMYICVPIGSFFPTWGYKFFPLTGKWFKLVFTRYHGFQAFRDSFVLSLIAAPITALLSMIISYLVVKRKFKAKGLHRGRVHARHGRPRYGSRRRLYPRLRGRRVPHGFPAGALRHRTYPHHRVCRPLAADRHQKRHLRPAADRQVHRGIGLRHGCGQLPRVHDRDAPLIKDSFLSGLVTAFVRSITAISAIILLVTPQFLLITVQINEFAEKGSYSLACAFATILILITYGAVLLMNLFIKYFGTSRKIKEDI